MSARTIKTPIFRRITNVIGQGHMMAQEFTDARERLEMTCHEFGWVIGINEETVRRYQRLSHKIPAPVAALVRLLIQDLDKAKLEAQS